MPEPAWSTTNEIDYLRAIGSWPLAADEACPPERKAELLLNYIRAAERRACWGEMDRAAVIRYAEGLLRTIRLALNQREVARLSR